MSPNADHASLLDRLVAVSDDQRLRELFAKAPVERLKSVIADYEQARASIASRGRLGATWADSSFEAEDETAPGPIGTR